MIEEGKTVPMFELSDADGNIVKTKDFKGKKFVVYFILEILHLDVLLKQMNFRRIIKNFRN